MNIRNLSDLVSWMNDSGQFSTLAASNLSQFGPAGGRLLGASILPELQDTENAFSDDGFDFEGLIGSSGADYSPAQVNKAFSDFKFDYRLGKIDAATTLHGRDIETIIQYLSKRRPSNAPVETSANLLAKWFDRGVIASLAKVIEHQRWQCIVDGIVKRRGANGYAENVPYPFPAGHQTTVAASGTVAAPAGWYSKDPVAAADALEDLLAAKQRLNDQGFTLDRIISRSSIRSVFMRNGKVRRNALPDGATRSTTLADIEALLRAHDLPNWETYDLGFKDRDPANSKVLKTFGYLERDTFDPVVLLASTTLEAQIELGKDTVLTLPNTMGSYVLGRPEGQTELGKIAKVILYDEKYPPSVYGEVVAKGLPVIDARLLALGCPISILKVPKPTP